MVNLQTTIIHTFIHLFVYNTHGYIKKELCNICYNEGYIITIDTYMLFASWEVRIVKNCDQGLENAA